MEAAATIPNDDRAWRVRVDLALCYRATPGLVKGARPGVNML